MPARLVPLGEGTPITLDRPIIFVGRHADCDVRIDSKKISRRHCCIVQLEDRLLIRDLGSTNGIYCNGQRVEEAVLAPHDEVQIANVRFEVVVDDLSPAPGSRMLGAGEDPPSPPPNSAQVVHNGNASGPVADIQED